MSPRGRPAREEVYRRLDVQIAELWERMGGLPDRIEAADVWRGIWFEEAHHSTAIEGNTLVFREVEALLTEGRAVGNKELREYMEIRGYAAAADWVYGQAIEPGEWEANQLITVTEIRTIHMTAMSPVWDVAPHPAARAEEKPGSFRQHNIEPFPGGMRPPEWPDVAAMMTDWVRTRTYSRRVHHRFRRTWPGSTAASSRSIRFWTGMVAPGDWS